MSEGSQPWSGLVRLVCHRCHKPNVTLDFPDLTPHLSGTWDRADSVSTGTGTDDGWRLRVWCGPACRNMRVVKANTVVRAVSDVLRAGQVSHIRTVTKRSVRISLERGDITRQEVPAITAKKPRVDIVL